MDSLRAFLADLERVLDRIIDKLIIVPLYGNEYEFESITDAINFIQDFIGEGNIGEFRTFEIVVRYSNGDSIDASFNTKEEVNRFLRYLAE